MTERVYYVSMRDPDNPRRFAFLLGPYDDHAAALGNVTRGSDLANAADPWAAFMAFGTASLPRTEARASIFGV